MWSSCYADADRNLHGHTYCDADIYCYIDTDGDAYVYGHAYSDADAYRHTDARLGEV
jgi:hypothetical protein